MIGFKLSDDGKSYFNDDRDIEVWPYDDDGTVRWGFTSTVLGFEIERDGYPTSMLAATSSLFLVPTAEEARVLVRETFDSMSDGDRLSLVQELNAEHGNQFEWSEAIPIEDFFTGLDIGQVIHIAIYGDISNEIDPVRYDKYGDAEQVSYGDLYSEICDNEDDILNCLVGVLESGANIYCTNYFDMLGYSISNCEWRELLE